MNEEQLRSLNDDWVNWFLNEQDRLLNQQSTNKLMHYAGSYGSPGSQTEGGLKYKEVAQQLEILNYKFLLYLVGKGHVNPDMIDLSAFNNPPKGF